MGRFYTLTIDAAGVTTAVDLFQIEAASGKPIFIHSVEFGQTTDYGDTEAEGLTILMRNRITGAITNGTGEQAIHKSDTASGANTNTNQTAVTTGAVTVYGSAWNIQIPFLWVPTPETRPFIVGGDAFTVNLNDAPTDALDITGTIVFEELG